MQTLPSEFAGWMQGHQARIESVLANVLPSQEVAPTRLHEAMRYAVLGGGKRIRPLLAYANEAVLPFYIPLFLTLVVVTYWADFVLAVPRFFGKPP